MSGLRFRMGVRVRVRVRVRVSVSVRVKDGVRVVKEGLLSPFTFVSIPLSPARFSVF